MLGFGGGRLPAGLASTGSVTVNVVPAPLLATATVPPCISVSPLTRASPMPRPPVVRSIDRSTWLNMSKMFDR